MLAFHLILIVYKILNIIKRNLKTHLNVQTARYALTLLAAQVWGSVILNNNDNTYKSVFLVRNFSYDGINCSALSFTLRCLLA